MSDCPGRFKCHGPASWCDECGDVDLVCDDPNCEVHLRSLELVCMEAQAAQKMDEAHAAYKQATKEWAEISAKLTRFKTGNVVMVARSERRKEIDEIALQGRRCPKCQSVMVHTRLGGYRCNRGCQ